MDWARWEDLFSPRLQSPVSHFRLEGNFYLISALRFILWSLMDHEIFIWGVEYVKTLHTIVSPTRSSKYITAAAQSVGASGLPLGPQGEPRSTYQACHRQRGCALQPTSAFVVY